MDAQLCRRLFLVGALSAIAQACSSIPKHTLLELQRDNENTEVNRAGRFVAQVLQASQPEASRGSQGSFQWLEYRSERAMRRLLLIIGPLGQPLGGIEQQLEAMGEPGALRVFDEQGQPLHTDEQKRMLVWLVGNSLNTHDTQLSILKQLMEFLATAAKSEQRIHETVVPLPDITLRFRLAFDAQ